MTKKRRWTLIALAVAAAAVALSLGLSGSGVEVEVAPVGRDTLRVMVREEGRTRVRDRFVVASPVTGRLERIDLDEGAPVAAGAVVARIFATPEDPRGLGVGRAQLSAAEARRAEVAAGVEQAAARAEQASREAVRRRELHEAGALSREALEQAELQAASAARQLEAARAGLRAASAEVEATRAALTGSAPRAGEEAAVEVRAPVAGRVLRVLEESERVVQAGTPLVELGDARGLEVVVDVLTEDAVAIEPGNPVRIEAWGGDRVLPGRVRRVDPTAYTQVSALGVEEQRVDVVVDLLEAVPALGAGYRVEAGIVTWEGADVLSVPTSALFQRGGEWRVFVVEDDRAELRSVELGRRSDAAAQVVQGLVEGERVILFPSDRIEDGVPVAPREVAAGAG